MRHLIKYIASLVLMLMAVLPMQAQTENQAFYIYQNDGHFDGFFYDEIEKMSFSFLDTLGVEHDEIVSQEIITADSTYRIMLSAIDSIGFVQPEIIYNPQVHIKGQDPDWGDFSLLGYMDYSEYYGEDHEIISFSRSIDDYEGFPMPQVGDVFVDPDINDGWSAKIVSLTRDYEGYEGNLVAICKPIDDISDILRQFIAVEEYGYNDDGSLARRRVAGMPQLNVGTTNKRASGDWEGDLFNFSINGQYPLWSGPINESNDSLELSVGASIDGKLHIKTVWDIPIIGKKYFSITTKASAGLSLGFTADGKIAESFQTGVGNLGQIPVPATFPLMMIDVGPDGFLRGEAHVKLSATSPRVGTSIWTKLEIIDWWPYLDMGFSKLDEEQGKYYDLSSAGVKLELDGYVQTGMLFPLKFKSLPLVRKFFDAKIGGDTYVGPKFSGTIGLDLTDVLKTLYSGTNYNIKAGEFAYNLLSNTKASVSLCDADYEIKAEVESAFGKKKKWSLANGTVSLFKPFEVSLVPEFGECRDYEDKRFINGEVLPCRILAFQPQGNVLFPLPIGVTLYDLEYGVQSSQEHSQRYTLVEGIFNQTMETEMVIPYYPSTDDNPQIGKSGRFKVRPYVRILGMEIASPTEYEFLHGVEMNVSSDTLVLNYDGSTQTPIVCKGNQDGIKPPGFYLPDHTDKLMEDFLLTKGSQGRTEISVDQKKWLEREIYGYCCKNYSPADTLIFSNDSIPYLGYAYINEQLFITDEYKFCILQMPNLTLDPKYFTTSAGWSYVDGKDGEKSGGCNTYGDYSNVDSEVSRLASGEGWHCRLSYSQQSGDNYDNLTMEFDYVLRNKPGVKVGRFDDNWFIFQNGHCTTTSYKTWIDADNKRQYEKHTATFSFDDSGYSDKELKIESSEKGTKTLTNFTAWASPGVFFEPPKTNND